MEKKAVNDLLPEAPLVNVIAKEAVSLVNAFTKSQTDKVVEKAKDKDKK